MISIRRENNSNVTEIHLGGQSFLFSYETLVAGYIPEIGEWRTVRKWSRTTEKHINWYIAGADPLLLTNDEKEALLQGAQFDIKPLERVLKQKEQKEQQTNK